MSKSKSTSQIEVIVNNIRKHGFLYDEDVVNFFSKRGTVFDVGLLVARIHTINKNPVKYGLPAGVKIASRPLLVDGKVKRIYCMVDAEKFVAVNAQKRSVRDKLKQFLTVSQAA